MSSISSNPYRPPRADAAAPAAEPERLHSMGAILLATLLGSLLGGGLVMAANARRLGHPATAILVLSALGSLALVSLLWLPEPAGTLASGLAVPAQLLIMAAIAKRSQEPAITEHRQAGRPFFPLWQAAALGLLATVAILALFVTGLLVIWVAAGRLPAGLM